MSWQKHIIKRQVIELHISGDADSRGIQDLASQVFREQVLPLLDQAFSKSSRPGTVEKIDRLELDLGTIPIGRLEELLVRNTAGELEKQLRLAAGKKTQAPPVPSTDLSGTSGADMDLIVYFLQTGLFPWWAKENTAQAFEQALNRLLLHDPSGLKSRLQPLLLDETGMKRLICAGRDALLYKILQVYVPAAVAGIKQHHAATPRGRLTWWKAVFSTAVDGQEHSAGGLIDQIAHVLACYDEELPEKRALLMKNMASAAVRQLADIQERLARQLIRWSGAGSSQEGARKALREIATELQAVLAALSKPIEGFGGIEALRQSVQRLTAIVRQAAALLKDPAPDNEATRVAASQSGLEEVRAWGEKLQSGIRLLMESVQPAEVTVSRQGMADKNLALNKPPRPSQKHYDPFSETEKVPVGNAGLVLLWPFLHRFFRNLELAEEKAFVDESAAEKACLLLQYLTGTAAGELFEAQLPLNKILCGIHWQQPVNTQAVIEPDEAEAADNFLQAVIQNGPLWKTLSVAGFRQAYLNREGLLSTRDGHWLLQVKRETYDVIVDRLPWSIQLVKLPWMEYLIFVEW